MVGLPARGKSIIANKIKNSLISYGLNVKIFNNGEVRRNRLNNGASPDFFDNNNEKGKNIRELIAQENINSASSFLNKKGNIAILDATNSTIKRRELIKKKIKHNTLFIECVNNNFKILKLSIINKSKISDFKSMDQKDAINSFKKRISFYEKSFERLDENNMIKIDSFSNKIINEKITDHFYFYSRIRDILTSDNITNLFLARHGETLFNQKGKIGGNSSLTKKGKEQALELYNNLKNKKIKYIFTSTKKRSINFAEFFQNKKDIKIIKLSEFNEINCGIFDSMTYNDIKKNYYNEYKSRTKDKYNYQYINGESYKDLKKRVYLGLRKAIYLSDGGNDILIIGHQAVNRAILSCFMFRNEEDVPYIHIPQDRYFHIISTHNKKVIEEIKYK